MPAILTLAAIKVIEKAVDELFDKAKARYLGPAAIDKRIYLGDFSAPKSLPGIFMAAAREEGAVPDKDIIAHLTRNAANYLDAYRSSTKAQVVKDVQAFLQEAAAKGVQTNVETVLGGKLADTWGKVTNDVKRLIDTEASNARNMGALEGIIGVNTSQGIEDPVVYFVVVRDEHLCDECKRLHLLEDETTPKLWYLSELKHGYHKRKEAFPALGGEHPHCRCTLVTLMPGYGFDEGGMVKYVSPDHDEMEQQRGLKKGVNQRLFPFDPTKVSPTEQQAVNAWQQFHHNEGVSRRDIPLMSPEALGRALNRLHGLTQTRRGANGEREFLLHRGMSRDEISTDMGKIFSHSRTSWTPYHDVARGFAMDYGGKTVSAWIPESKIRSVPNQLGDVMVNGKGRNGMRGEGEVIVDPHEAELERDYRKGPPIDFLERRQKGGGIQAIRARARASGRGPGTGFLKAEEPLEKSDWPTSKYLAELARFGWVPTDRSAKHPTFTNKWFTPARPLALKHSEMRRIGIENMENSAKDVGLIWDYDGLRANPKHPYAEHYRKQGLLEPDPNAPPPMKTWTPEGPHKHVAIDTLVSTKPHLEAWQHLKYKKLLADGQHQAVPPISTMELEGQHHVLDGDEQLQAAKDLGYTHVPVRAG